MGVAAAAGCINEQALKTIAKGMQKNWRGEAVVVVKGVAVKVDAAAGLQVDATVKGAVFNGAAHGAGVVKIVVAGVAEGAMAQCGGAVVDVGRSHVAKAGVLNVTIRN